MTRLAIDAAVAVRIITEKIEVAPEHSLVAPSLLRSDVLSRLYRDAREGRRTGRESRALLEDFAALKIRLLGDRVSRAVAFGLAERLGHDDTARAEYLAVAKLQADVLVTDDDALIAGADGVIAVRGVDALTG